MSTSMAELKSLAPEQVDEYNRTGYLVLRRVFEPSEIAELASEADSLLARKDLIDTNNIRCRWKDHFQTKACMFECFDPVVDLSPLIGKFARDPRVLDILADVYGEPAWPFKDKLIFKPPGVLGYNLHQDYIGWTNFPKSFITVLVPIDACDEENGCTVVYPGYHWEGYLSASDGNYHDLPADAVDKRRRVPLVLEPGDLAIFGCFTPHGSSPNRSDGFRRQLYLSYNADSDGGDRRAAHYEEFHAWLRGKYAEYGKTEVYFR